MFSEKLQSRIYRLARKLRPVLPYGILGNLAQWLFRSAHEPDFDVFEWLTDTDGLVLDIGACRGQSAISIMHLARRMHVFSAEPNPKHRWSLLFVWLVHPFRFRFRLVAAGADFARMTLYVPGRRASGLSAQASLDPAEFDKDYVRERLEEAGFDAADKSGYRLVPARVVPLDSFAFSPDLIKMDVEGFEQQALQGLEETIRSRLPALLIEINNTERWMPYLQTLGYGFFYYDPMSRVLRSFDNDYEVLNLFCLHGQSDSALTRILLENVST